MVYCGKPSRGCQMCRTRRIKCDETKPTCNQCAKSRRQCPGYKDEFDLVLRNETKATERRAKKAGRKAITQKRGEKEQQIVTFESFESSTATTSLSTSFQGVVKSPLDQAISPTLIIPPETHASCHFMSNFVLVPRQGSTRGFLDYLVPLLKSTEVGSRHMMHAFNACALASMGNRIKAYEADFSTRAHDEYIKAIQVTNIALRHPEASKSDATLAAVLLMGLFENITASKPAEFGWGSHIEGAIQITKARGRKQLRSKTGLLLFIAVRTQVMVHSLSTSRAPAMGAEWWITDAVKNELAAACQRICLKTAEVRAEVTRMMAALTRTPENIDLVLAMIRRAQLLDQEAVSWTESVPEAWHWKTLCWEDHVPGGDYGKAEVFPGRVDVYNDFWIASVWNMSRTARMVLATTTIRCAAWVCSPMNYRTTPEYATASRIVADMVTDIIASVPYHLGWHTKKQHLFNNLELSGFACGEEDSTKGLPGYFLTWPLGCIMTQDHVTDPQRQWVSGRLRYIGDTLGLKYARILADMQIRIPSMLIRFDAILAQPQPQQSSDVAKLLSGKLAPPPFAYTVAQQQQYSIRRPLEQ